MEDTIIPSVYGDASKNWVQHSAINHIATGSSIVAAAKGSGNLLLQTTALFVYKKRDVI